MLILQLFRIKEQLQASRDIKSNDPDPQQPLRLLYQLIECQNSLREEVFVSGDQAKSTREFLLVSDFDQTLSFNDSGVVLSELLGVSGFRERVAGLANIHLVQQGGELAYLILHDPEYRRVRKEHLLQGNQWDGMTIAVSENKYVTQIASRTVLSDDALSVLVPILEAIAGWDSTRIRALFESHGFVLQEWAKVRTDSLTIALAPAGA